MPSFELGESIPPDTAHAVSVSLPTWKANVGYEEGQPWVIGRMVTGYPRFFIHKSIAALAEEIVARYGQAGQVGMCFPTRQSALRCINFIRTKAPSDALSPLSALDFVLDSAKPEAAPLKGIAPAISVVLCLPAAFPFAKQYWQHTGDFVSSRRAEFCHGLLNDGLLIPDERPASPTPVRQKPCRGPRRYQRPLSVDETASHAGAGSRGQVLSEKDVDESSRFLEERFGRNLDISFVERARIAIKRRIAGTLTRDIDLTTTPLPELESSTRGIANLSEDDIYLFPCGMNAIFNAHCILSSVRGPMKSINFGFPYVDTLKILQKFGPGCVFYGHASKEELDDLERRLQGGEKFLGLFCEFPGNPLLTCPDLVRIRKLADQYDFAVVVDETIGTFANINVLQFADIVVSSLTKIFSGDCNVMGGSLVLNPHSRYYNYMKPVVRKEYVDTYWAEDVIFMERNSRDFAGRIERVNANAEAISDVLLAHPTVQRVYYPKHNESRRNYDVCKLPHGGYGGLLSVVFHRKTQAMAFYDAIETAKGPSLGTNFTLTSPYVILAHYQELDWAAELGVSPYLLRISVGLEETDQLISVFQSALRAAEAVQE